TIIAILIEEPIGVLTLARLPCSGAAIAQLPRAEAEDGERRLARRRARRIELAVHMRRHDRVPAEIAVTEFIEDAPIIFEPRRREIDERHPPGLLAGAIARRRLERQMPGEDREAGGGRRLGVGGNPRIEAIDIAIEEPGMDLADDRDLGGDRL